MGAAVTKKATAFLIIIAGALILGWAGPARADLPVTFEPGTGKYILVLEDPRTEIDDPVTGKKKAREPDVQKHGGTVLHKNDATRVIKLPTRAAVALRKEENVAYLQRIWLGESREEWGEEAQQSSLKTAVPETLDTDLTWTTGTYLYDGSGNIKQIGTDTYRYDTVGRLAQAVVKGITETYQYDSFGNLVGKTVNGQHRPVPVDASSNRLQGEAYDAAGNVTTQAGQPRYHYDSFSMVDRWERPPSNRKRYIYGPDDERIGTVLQEGSFSRWKIRDFSGKVLREFKADDTQGYWEWIEDYAYADGRLLAAERESYYGGKRHFHTDHLGSVRMITDQSRKRIAVHDFSAFGVEQTDAAQEYNRYAGAGGGGDFRAEPMKFTGHERDQHGWLNVDNDDSLDYMHARYYDPNLGRFLSVDPTWASANVAKPQTWNRYSYVLNDPANATDPDGRLTLRQLSDRYKDASERLKPVVNALSQVAPAAGITAFAATAAKTLMLGSQTGQNLDRSSTKLATAVAKDVGIASEFTLTVAGTAAPLAKALTSGKDAIMVIGRMKDTAVLAGKEGHAVLSNTATVPQQDAWIAHGIANGRTFYLGSEVTSANIIDTGGAGLTRFGRELMQLMNARYVRNGMRLIPGK
jgi:RHS repeat-associated protein